jgi:predicted Zn-dependent protease with MMP-like domain
MPAWVRDALENVAVIVVDEATEELEPDRDGLLGLYVGQPFPDREANHAGDPPDVIYLFFKPHLALGLSERALRREIQKTLMHEIAHLFGFDDDHLREIGWD